MTKDKKNQYHSPNQVDAPMDEHNAAMLTKAHKRLDLLAGDAAHNKLFGTVSIALRFENGRITIVERVLNGTDKN